MGAILNKFNQYIKWGASKFTDNFDVLASTKDGSDGIQTHLYEIRKKTGEAISSLETSVDYAKNTANGKITNNGGSGYTTGAEIKSKITTAQTTANSGVSKANTAQARADSAYNLAGTANTHLKLNTYNIIQGSANVKSYDNSSSTVLTGSCILQSCASVHTLLINLESAHAENTWAVGKLDSKYRPPIDIKMEGYFGDVQVFADGTLWISTETSGVTHHKHFARACISWMV